MKRLTNKENQPHSPKKFKNTAIIDINIDKDKLILNNSTNHENHSLSNTNIKDQKIQCDNNELCEQIKKCVLKPKSDDKNLKLETCTKVNNHVNINSRAYELKHLLKNPNFSGELFLCGQAKQLPVMPGLAVKDIDLSMPLCQSQLDILIKAADLSSFGYYVIDGSLIKFNNPEWSKNITSLVNDVVTEMGYLAEKCSFNLQNLELFPTGSFALERKCNIKDAIANLIIQLPSSHTGGDLFVYCGDSNSIKRKFKFDQKSSKYEILYSAFSTFLQHDLQEIKSGHRILLNYTIFSKETIDFAGKKSKLLEMSKILNELNKTEAFTIVLDEQYNCEQIKNKGLKVLEKLDKSRFALLSNANSILSPEMQYSFLIAHLTCDVKTDLTYGYGFNHKEFSYHEEYEEVGENVRKSVRVTGEKKFGFVKKTVDFFNSNDTDDEDYEDCNDSNDSESDEDMSDSDYSCDNDTDDANSHRGVKKEYDAIAKYRKNQKNKKEEELSREKCLKDIFDTQGSQLETETNFSFNFLNIILNPSSVTKTNVEDLEDLDIWCKTQNIKIHGTRLQSVIKTTTYHKYALILLPKFSQFEIFLKADSNIAIDYLFKLINDDDDENLEIEAFKNKLDKVVKKLIVKNKLLKDGPAWWLVNKQTELESKRGFKYYNECTIKMLQILKFCQDIEITKIFIEKCLLFASEQICYHLADLIVLFGWKELESSLKNNLLFAQNDENICNSCFLIQSLNSLNKIELAKECYNDLILPLIEDPLKFEKIKSSKSWYYIEANYEKHYLIYYKLAETIVLFCNPKESMLKFQKCIQHKLEFPEFNKLIEKLIKNIDKFNSVKSIVLDFLSILMLCQKKNMNSIKIKIPIGNNLYIHAEKLNISPDCAYRHMESLTILKDIELAKFFVKNLMDYTSDNLAIKFAELIICFEWESLRNFIIPKLKPISEANIQFNCHLAKSLSNMKQENAAQQIIKEAILPILDKPNDFVKLIDLVEGRVEHLFSSENYYTYFNLFHLFEVILLYTNKDTFNVSSNKYTHLTRKMIPQNVQKAILDQILINSNVYKSEINEPERIKFLKDLFDIHLNWLETFIKRDTYEMPNAKLTSHPKVEKFLNSNQEKMLYFGKFKDLKHATNFINKYSGTKNNFSTKMQVEYEVKGKQKNIGVSIAKTDKYFIRAKKFYQIEYDFLKAKLSISDLFE